MQKTAVLLTYANKEPQDSPVVPLGRVVQWISNSAVKNGTISYFKSRELQIQCITRECVRNLDLRVQVHPEELWVSKQRVHIVLEASKSAGAKGDVPKICGFVHPLHPL